MGGGSVFPNRPRMLVCYLCGREYGTKSLPIHIPQCQEKWLNEESKKPKSKRRPLPEAPTIDFTDPDAIAQLKNDTNAIDDFNNQMFNQWEQSVLERCPFCDRTFTSEALKRHAKSCTADNPAKPAGTGLGKASLSRNLEPGLISGTLRMKAPTQQDPDKLPTLQRLQLSSIEKNASPPPTSKAQISRGLRVGKGETSAPASQNSTRPSTSGGFTKSPASEETSRGSPLPALETKPCHKCGRPPMRPNAKFCWSCGAECARQVGGASQRLKFASKFCDDCGAGFAPEATFCSKCGIRRLY